MRFRSTIAIYACTLFLFSPGEKKEQILKLSKKYFPENYVVIKEYDESSINSMAPGNSLNEYLNEIPTVVHEGYHHYTGTHGDYSDSLILFRINDTLSFYVRSFKTFPAIEINNIVPDSVRKRVFRYETYINSKDKYLVTQQFGILGMLEEMAAYYQSFHTCIALFKYHSDHYGWKNTKVWMDYLGHMGSYRYSITEFELFISWYLQYAKSKYPAIYKDIIANKGLKKMVLFLHNEKLRLESLYNRNRLELMDHLGKQLVIDGSFIYDKKTYTGSGLSDDDVKEMEGMLSKPEHKIYRDLLTQ